MTTTPDGKQFYVTCEAGGDIYVIDARPTWRLLTSR